MDNPLRPLPVDLDELALALTSHIAEYGHYFDLQTGDILYLPRGLENYAGADESKLASAFDFGAPDALTDALRVVGEPQRGE